MASPIAQPALFATPLLGGFGSQMFCNGGRLCRCGLIRAQEDRATRAPGTDMIEQLAAERMLFSP